MAVDPARAKSLFLAASDLESPAERAAYLDRECVGEAGLRARIEALLAADAGPGQFPEPESAGISATTAPLDATRATVPETSASSELATGAQQPGLRTTAVDTLPVDQDDFSVAGRVIAGRYTLLEVLGEGGMGTVYRADQTQPVRRQVALKLIKIGMDSRAVLARFDAERQALALMDHPNIARVYDGGTTESNQPFFVMELVQGAPITDYCDQKRLPVRARLELFVAVCQAVQHAHQKGIIHRDLKPNNVMVTEVDGRPTPKVIDFGVAKATEVQLTDQSLGDTGAIVGTPSYMSPEQADPSSMDIDTRTDVYALGVILYELLAGSPPIDARQFKRGAILEMLRMVREVDPPRPSTKVSTAEALPSIAASRDLTPEHLKRALTGDLDWIVMKAIEKDRSRRYETANGFAADILRHLAYEPVVAAPPSRAYRLRKFVRKNRGAVIAASLVLFALLAGVIGTTWGMVRAERSASAERSAKLKAQQKTALAEKRLAQIEKGNAILTSIFDDLNIRKAKEGTEPLEAILAHRLVKAAGQLEGESVGDPMLMAGLQAQLGVSLQNLGFAAEAIPLFEKSRATVSARLGPDHVDTITAMNNLAVGYQAVGRRDEAIRLFEETLRLSKASLGPDHEQTILSMNSLAQLYQQADRIDKTFPLLEEALRLSKVKFGTDHPNTLVLVNNLAEAYQYAGRLDEALPLIKETLRLRKARLGLDHPETLESLSNLAANYVRLKRLHEAIPLYEEALKRMERRMGRQHPGTLIVALNLGAIYQDLGRLAEALPLLEECHAAGNAHPELVEIVPYAHYQLIDAYLKAGKTTEAARLLAELLADVRRRQPQGSPQLAGQLAPIGRLMLRAGAFAQAEPLLRECLAIREKAAPDDRSTFMTRSLLGGALLGQKRYAEAKPLLVEGYKGMKAKEKDPPPLLATQMPEALDRLIELSSATNRPDEAARWRAERANYPAPGGKK